MTRIGLLVNPDAGLGGRLGLKGSDGQAAAESKDASRPHLQISATKT